MGEKTWGRSDDGVIFCKIDIWSWFVSGSMPEVGVIDISNQKKLAKVFKGGPGQCSLYVQQNQEHLIKTRECKEVLLKWRGRIPLKYFTVIDTDTGEDIGSLQWFIERAMHSREAGIGIADVVEESVIRVAPSQVAPSKACGVHITERWRESDLQQWLPAKQSIGKRNRSTPPPRQRKKRRLDMDNYEMQAFGCVHAMVERVPPEKRRTDATVESIIAHLQVSGIGQFTRDNWKDIADFGLVSTIDPRAWSPKIPRSQFPDNLAASAVNLIAPPPLPPPAEAPPDDRPRHLRRRRPAASSGSWVETHHRYSSFFDRD